MLAPGGIKVVMLREHWDLQGFYTEYIVRVQDLGGGRGLELCL